MLRMRSAARGLALAVPESAGLTGRFVDMTWARVTMLPIGPYVSSISVPSGNMTIQRSRPFGQNYAFVVAGVTFLALLAAAGVRAAPGVLILPLGQAFGWSRDT